MKHYSVEAWVHYAQGLIFIGDSVEWMQKESFKIKAKSKNNAKEVFAKLFTGVDSENSAWYCQYIRFESVVEKKPLAA